MKCRRSTISLVKGTLWTALATAAFSCSSALASGDDPGTAGNICAQLVSKTSSLMDAADRDAVVAFYIARDCRPVWVDTQGPTRAARLAIEEIRHAEDWGLKGEDFKIAANAVPMIDGTWTGQQTVAAELEITRLVLRYAHQAQGGRIPQPDKLLSSYLDRQPQVAATADVLAQVSVAPDPGAVLRSYQPPQDQFLKLKALLAKLRGKPANDDVVTISRNGPLLMSGSTGPEVAQLKKRLNVTSKPGKEQVFDDALESAVRVFQRGASLARDGMVGPMTRAALAGDTPGIGTPSMITAVLANMEEWRWMPRSLGTTYAFVNIPSFTVTLNDKGHEVLQQRVVVGTENTQTPIFSKDMTTVVLKPQWFLPDSIKMSALLSGRSIESQGLVVMRNGHKVDSWRVNWANANIKEYAIYQPSGDDNALGLVKMLFPNKHSVYLHDTPSKYLFNEPVRLFSHGCMRVQNPQDVAQAILTIDRGKDAPDVKGLIRKGPMDNQFTLNTPMPVHVGYFTVWVDENGQPTFYNDYYGHQKRITLALAGRWNEIDVGKDHLAETDMSQLKAISIGDPGKGGGGKKHRHDDDDAPTAVTYSYSRYNDSVGDMIRRSLSE